MTDSIYDTRGMGSVGSDDERLNLDQNDSVKKVYTLLHYASSCGDEEIFRLVLDQCKNLPAILLDDRANNDTNETPLHFAVSCNNMEIVKILVTKIRDIVCEREEGGKDGDRNYF